MNKNDFRIERIHYATVNGRMRKVFDAYRRGKNCYVFVGQFSAPALTPNGMLWRIAAEGADND